MNPFYFGASAEPLFGVYHPPYAGQERSTGVVLCYPAGQEYMRAHRAFRQLGLLLSRAGFPVLRFDYFGTGDSAGEGDDATLERWTADIGAAIEELRDTAGVEQVALVGLRLGGTIGVLAAAGRLDVCHIVLWDPVVAGSSYVEKLLLDADAAGAGASSASNGAARRATIGVQGFPFSEELRSGIAQVDLKRVQPPTGAQTLVIVSKDNADQRALADVYQQTTGRARFLCIPSDGNWNEVDDFGSALIPQAIIRAIVDHLSESAR